ncbi:hypothetical protein ACI01nite_03640 [Acetobacter cibinongensis]|uniref:Secreted protein n=1 Tax=Acetobacter cibinongensis TaxID=146475 RepID=A0ABQ0V2J4_9PROT|nr:hypothetical protein ACI01nite_03640 [Acetobacter cibinongensis]
MNLMSSSQIVSLTAVAIVVRYSSGKFGFRLPLNERFFYVIIFQSREYKISERRLPPALPVVIAHELP